jgi:hypothetical protein
LVSWFYVTSTSVFGPFNVQPPRIIYFTPIEAHIRYVKPALLAVYDIACTTWKNALLAVCKEKSGSLYHRTQQHNCLCGANKTKKKPQWWKEGKEIDKRRRKGMKKRGIERKK